MTTESENRVENPILKAQLTGGILTIKPVGPNVGQREAPIIDNDVKPLFAKAGAGLKAVVLDLHDVTFMSSMGLGTCIAIRTAATEAGAKTAITGFRPELEQLFKMMRIHKMFDIQKNDAALDKWILKQVR